MRARALIIVISVAAAALAVGGLAWGVVRVYKNDFRSRSEFREIRKLTGGKQCKKAHEAGERFATSVESGPKECIYRSPVQGDGSGPNQEVEAKVKLNKATSSKIRKRVYLGIGVRAAKRAGYQLRIYPQRQEWELHRTGGGEGFPVKGKLEKINKAGKSNKLRLRAFGNKVSAWVNGDRVVSAMVDRDAAEVDGQLTTLLIASTKKTGKRAKGSFDDYVVKVSDP
jgi:hypothetical protein